MFNHDEPNHNGEGTEQEEENDLGADVAAESRLLVDVDLLVRGFRLSATVAAMSIVATARHDHWWFILDVHERRHGVLCDKERQGPIEKRVLWAETDLSLAIGGHFSGFHFNFLN